MSDALAMVGLYDATGMLRFVGSSIEACMEYANLFDLSLLPSSLQTLPEPIVASIKVRGDLHLEERSNGSHRDKSFRCPWTNSAMPPGFSNLFW